MAITNREGHPNLLIGDRITAGDFVVTITDISSEANGVISGSGFVRVPYFEMARFGVVFDNILVNTDYQLAEGEIVTLYDPEFGESAEMIIDIPITQWLNTIGGLINNLRNDVQEALTSGNITQEQADQAAAVIAEQQERINEIKENQEEAEKLREEGKEEEAKKLEEENKKIQQEIDQQLQSIPEQLGIKDDGNGNGTLQSDAVFDGVVAYGEGTDSFIHTRIDNNEIVDFANQDPTNKPPDVLEYDFPYDGKSHRIIVTHSGNSGEVLEEARQKVANPKDGELIMYFHYDTKKGELGYKVNFAQGYFPKMSEEDFLEIQRLHQEALFNLMQGEQLTASNVIGILKNSIIDTYKSFKQVLYDIKLPEKLWDSHTHKGEEFYMEPLTAGLTDGVIEEVKSIPLLISIVVDYTTDEKTRSKINQAIINIDVEKIITKFVKDRDSLYSGKNKDKIKHTTGKDIVAAGTMLGTGGASSLGKIKKGVDFIQELAAKAKKAIVKGDYSNFKNLAKVTDPDFLKKLDELGLDESALKKLDDDLADAKLLDEFIKDPDLAVSWKKMNDLGIDDSLRKNPEVLKKTKKFNCK